MMMDAVPEPGRTLIAVAAFSAIRRGERRGLRWEDYRNGAIHVSRSVWNGKETDPKTAESKNAVPVVPKLATVLAEHHKSQGKPKSGWIFPNRKGNAVDPNSVLNRTILPSLAVCQVCSKVKDEHSAASGHEYERNAVSP